MAVLNGTSNLWHYDCCMLAGLERHQRRVFCGCVRRLPWCWTEEAAPWISQQLRLVVLHIACVGLFIALCWCWQCSLKVGGNLLPHILTPLGVTTVAWCCRQTQDFLHPAEWPPGTLQPSEWQKTASVITTWHCTGGSCSVFTADKCLHMRFLCWTGVTDSVQMILWIMWDNSVPCHSLLHITEIFN